MMKSLVATKTITRKEYDNFFESIETVATKFIEDLTKVKLGEISKEDFINIYGHLRPGTYDIISRTYEENFDQYFDIEKFSPPKKNKITFSFSIESKQRIQKQLNRNQLGISTDEFLMFVRKAVIGREKTKFEFTKCLNKILIYIEQAMKPLGISRKDSSFIPFQDILELAYTSFDNHTVYKLKKQIALNKKQFSLTQSINLPPLIFFDKSVKYFTSTDSLPNFVTHKKVIGECVYLTGHEKEIHLQEKIVLIKNADPGYDWIFSHKIAGLITEFGGAASHMTIRATEFQLPAAIGCGTTLFNLLKGAQKIELDCSAKRINPLL